MKKLNVLSKIFDLILKAKEILAFVSVIVAWVLAMWVTNRLAPFVQSDREMRNDINAQAADITIVQSDIKSLEEKISKVKEDTSYIRGAIDAHMKGD